MVHIIGCFRYATVYRRQDTTFTSLVASDTSQYTVVVIQRSHRWLLPIRHSIPSSWYNVHIIGCFRYVTVYRRRDTKFTSLVPSDTPQYTVVVIQRSHRWLLPVRHSIPSPWYNVHIVGWLRYATVLQRWYCWLFPVPGSIKTPWYNVRIIGSFRYVTVYRRRDTGLIFN